MPLMIKMLPQLPPRLTAILQGGLGLDVDSVSIGETHHYIIDPHTRFFAANLQSPADLQVDVWHGVDHPPQVKRRNLVLIANPCLRCLPACVSHVCSRCTKRLPASPILVACYGPDYKTTGKK